jgi:hypothetical protein
VYLKRQSSGINFLYEDVNAVDAETTICSITNLNECGDGVYKVVPWNIHRDRESGHPDGCDFKLIPFNKKDASE